MTEARHDFDEQKLATYLEQQVEGFRGPLTAKKFPGGQSNPTFAIDAASGRYVLRRKPPGTLPWGRAPRPVAKSSSMATGYISMPEPAAGTATILIWP